MSIIHVVKKPFFWISSFCHFKKETIYELYTFCQLEIIFCQKLTYKCLSQTSSMTVTGADIIHLLEYFHSRIGVQCRGLGSTEYLQSISRMRNICHVNLKCIFNAFVISCLDYCNSILYGLLSFSMINCSEYRTLRRDWLLELSRKNTWLRPF